MQVFSYLQQFILYHYFKVIIIIQTKRVQVKSANVFKTVNVYSMVSSSNIEGQSREKMDNMGYRFF